MIKDIHRPHVEQVGFAITIGESEQDEMYTLYLINLREETLEQVLITTRGYGEIDKKEKITSTLRHHFDSIDGEVAVKVELIPKEALALNHEFWLSFYIGKELYDKRFTFLSGAFHDENLIIIPHVEKKGILII
jgi:hypothetical protein